MSARPGIPQYRNRPAEPDDNWRTKALCTQTDPDSFFPKQGELQKSRDAKQICRRCTVRAPCLSYALWHNEAHGVWGGYSERERRALKRERTAS